MVGIGGQYTDVQSVANLFTVLEAVVIAIYISAKILTYTGDVTRMRMSLRSMQEWLDRIPEASSKVEAQEKVKDVDPAPGFTL